MANFLLGEVPLKIADGRSFTLVFDMEALIEAEGAYGKPMHATMIDASKGFMGALRAVLFGAFRAHHPEFDLKAVADLLAENTDAISDALTAAHEKAMPAPTPSAPGNANPAPVRRRPGKTSGGNGAKRTSTRTRSGG